MVDFSELNRKYPRITDLEPADFQRMSIDRQMNDFWREEAAFRSNQQKQNFVPTLDSPDPNLNLKVPSIDRPEFRPYQQTTPYRTYPANPDPYYLNEELGQYQMRQSPYAPPSTPGSTSTAPAAPPSTPARSGAAPNPNLNMTDPPPTGMPKAPIATVDPVVDAPPSGLPEAAGAGGAFAAQQIAKNAAFGGIGAAAATFTYDVITGKPPIDAAGKAISVGGGTAIGSVLGSPFGPVGMFLGGAIGGAIGGALYDRFAHPPSAQPQLEGYIGQYPFTGGQSPGVDYDVVLQLNFIYRADGRFESLQDNPERIKGPIAGVSTRIEGDFAYITISAPVPYTRRIGGTGDIQRGTWSRIWGTIAQISRTDGLPDTGGNPPPEPIPQDNRQYITINNYGNAGYAPPTAEPAPKPAPTAYAPGAIPIATFPGAHPTGEPHPDTAAPPMLLPDVQPTGTNNTSNNPLGGSVTFDPTTGVVTFVAPGSPSAKNPALNPWQQALPTSPPLTATPLEPSPLPTATGFRNTSDPSHNTPSSISTTAKPTPTPDAVSLVPKSQPAPSTQPTTSPATEQAQKQFDDMQKQITSMGIALVGFTQYLQGIQNNTAPEAIRNAAKEGTCQSLNGGCSTGTNYGQQISDAATNSAANKGALERLLGLFGDGASLANLALIPKVLTKLTKFVDWSVGDRVIGMMSMVASVHNAFMLSNNVGQTLFSIFDNLGNTGKLIINPEGDANIDSKQWVTHNMDSLFNTMLGAERWTSIKAAYKAANNIFNTSANLYNNLRSIHNDSQELLNMVRRDTAELGNALVEEGLISEDNWEARDPKIKIKSKSLARLANLTDNISALDDKLQAIETMTSTLLNITQTAKEIKDNITDLNKELGDANGKFKEARDKAIEALPDPIFDIDDLF